MAPDDLSRPLGVESKPAKPKRVLPWGRALMGATGLLALCIGAYLFIVRDPLGGEPHMITAIEVIETPKPAQVADVATQQASADLPLPPAALAQQTAKDLEQEAGITVHRGNGVAPGAVVLKVPDSEEDRKPGKVRPNLSQSSRHGVLPVIGADGLRPLDAYARKAAIMEKPGPRIALVVGGLGIGQNVTSEAIRRLPPDVALAFAPYGTDLVKQVARARDDGHEVFLHLPMEPYDYPDNDPGPQTLVTGKKPAEIRDRLHWLMSRFQGYVGVMNYMGARFLGSDADFQIVAKELSERGLGYLSDGTVRDDGPEALVRANGGAANAGTMIDLSAEAEDIAAALEKLETLAREKGTAIGVASALPVSIKAIADWSKGAAERGIMLVPVSSLIGAKTP
jgi:uncharacterized protein